MYFIKIYKPKSNIKQQLKLSKNIKELTYMLRH